MLYLFLAWGLMLGEHCFISSFKVVTATREKTFSYLLSSAPTVAAAPLSARSKLLSTSTFRTFEIDSYRLKLRIIMLFCPIHLYGSGISRRRHTKTH